ncbi:MAG: thermonuclease family protein, partial [Armatimonadetes bacterium]|nr:thermonuclease family protein [Armatimonadota bacterium]
MARLKRGLGGLLVAVALLAVGWWQSRPAEQADGAWAGECVGVADGDTITVMHQGRGEKIRLNGVDSPEKGQAFGSTAKEYVSQRVFGREVRVQPLELDSYGRTIGEVYLADGSHLNADLVSAGLAWWYREYAPDNADLRRREAAARAARRGLWADRR